MRYVLHPEALNEYAEAVQYYTEQRIEVAQAFINAIEDTVYRIRDSPTRYAVIEDDVRRCLCAKVSLWNPLHDRARLHSYFGNYALQPRAWILEKS
jgi:plasmid stabilization system protein ParE